VSGPADPTSATAATTPPPASAVSPGRTRLALLSLALGGFGIGATEFVAMGLLPDLARDLLPAVWARSQEDAVAQAGWLISAYALGVVVGAPTIATVAARYPRRRLLLVLVGGFTLFTVASALAPTFEMVLAMRFVAALGHGAFFGVAALVAAQLMGPGRRAQGVALVLSGLTVANVVGVPLITLLGQQAGWRVAYLAVAAVFAAAFAAMAALVPSQPGDRAATIRRELTAFRRPQVWLTLGVGAIGFGGFFAVYSYIAQVVTEVTGLGAGVTPIVLVLLGVGMTAGNLVGGRLADRDVMRTVFAGFGALILSLIAFALTSTTPVGLFLSALAVGFTSSAVSPAIQTRLMDVAGDSQTLAAAINHSSLNIGNSLGAFLGGLVIAAGFGYLAPTWVGLGLAAVGVAVAVVSVLLERRTGAIAHRPTADEEVAPVEAV